MSCVDKLFEYFKFAGCQLRAVNNFLGYGFWTNEIKSLRRAK